MKVSTTAILQSGIVAGVVAVIVGLAATSGAARPASAALPFQPTTTGSTPTVESTATQETPTVDQTATEPASTATTEPSTSTPTPTSTPTSTPTPAATTVTATATATATQAPPTATPTVATPTAQAPAPAQPTPTPVSPNVGNSGDAGRSLSAGWLIVLGIALAGTSALGLAARRMR